MADVLIRDTALQDVVHLAHNLRPSDLREAQAYGHPDLVVALSSSAARSVLCWSAFVDGELACVIGVAPISMLNGQGSPWMMGTPVLDRHHRILVRRTPEYITRMLTAFPHLMNFVHAENTTSVRWLRRLGFTLHDPVPYGAQGELFHPFELKA